MIYIGLDVSIKSIAVHAVNEKRKVVRKGAIECSRKGLKKLLNSFGNEPKLVAFEAGNQLKWIALLLKQQANVDVWVVNPNEVKWISASSSKTDKVDARKLAELARGGLLPRRVHVVEGKTRRLRELLSARRCLQRKRVDLVNTIRGYALQEGVVLPKGFFRHQEWSGELLALKLDETFQLIVTSMMEAIDGLKASEQELTDKILEIEDGHLELLESVPGLGKLASRVVLSALDDAKRFDNKKSVAKYGALCPRIHQSGRTTHLGRINPDGRKELRRVLLQGAHTVARMKSHIAQPLVAFFERIRHKRGKKIAIVALARKILTIAYAVLNNGEFYNPAVLTPGTVQG